MYQLLYEGELSNSGEQPRVLRLLCKLVDWAQVFPERFLLEGVEMSADPFAIGGFSDIYEGKHELGRVCVKVIRVVNKDDQTQILTQSAREIILWAHMSHENILPFYGVYALDASTRKICLVSPFMENGSLRDFLRKHPTTHRLPLIQDVIEGLLYLHRSEIVHGDLKALNILVSNDRRALIADFGLSRLALTTLVGSTEANLGHTTNWSAPEVVVGWDGQSSKPSKQSDIWSFGCLCYEVYTGKPPYYEYQGTYQVLAALAKRSPPKRPPMEELACDQLDDTIWNLLTQGCWKSQPEERYTCEAVRDALVYNSPQRKHTSVSHWDEQKLAFWTAMKHRSGSYVDYDELGVILNDFLESYEKATESS
ncbi:Serine/threonine-protein kinase HT1 [Leucoagaricus sp. SymC.cos]|nr:Serine/threonine-protein kinase HT1 [Leucoagaricus sp. SymC.cos]